MTSAIERLRKAARKRAAQERSRQEPGRDVHVLGTLDRIFTRTPDLGEGYDQTHGFVKNSAEFRRVFKLPRVDWTTDADELGRLIDLEFGRGTMHVRPVQAATLAALHDHGGAFGAIGVGEGKTLISFLAPSVIEAERPLLLVPAKLREKTEREFEVLAEHWTRPPEITIVSYEKLGRVSGADEIESLSPDLIVADEAHRLKNTGAACTRRLVRYLREHPECRFLPMSGTITSRSLRDFHHLILLALGSDRAPLPVPKDEIRVWANAVDEGTQTRARPGCLRLLLPPGQDPSLDNVRAAVGKRIFETPAVIRTELRSVESSIVCELVNPKIDPRCRELIKAMIKDKRAPNGDEVLPVDVYRHTRTLVLGFFYRWDPEPPEVWVEARKRWRAFVRDVLDLEDPRFDSELQVAQAAAAFDRARAEDREPPNFSLDSAGAFESWSLVRDEFKINSVPVWISTSVLERIAESIREPTIVWAEHQAAGEKMSEISGLPYYHRKGLDAAGNFVDDHDPGSSLIASIASNSEGRNLQAWSRNLVLTPPANGRAWEQLLGRTHRAGQLEDEIAVSIVIGHPMIKDQLAQAVADARYIQATSGNPQKLLLSNLGSMFQTKTKTKDKP